MFAPRKSEAVKARSARQGRKEHTKADAKRAAEHARVDYDAMRKDIVNRFPKTLARLAE